MAEHDTPRDGDAERLIAAAERVVAAFEEHWGALQAHRRKWLRTMIAGALAEQDSDARAKAEIENLRAALQPFAEFYPKAQAFVMDRAEGGGSPVMPSKDFRLADFLRAKEALAGPAPEVKR